MATDAARPPLPRGENRLFTRAGQAAARKAGEGQDRMSGISSIGASASLAAGSPAAPAAKGPGGAAAPAKPGGDTTSTVSNANGSTTTTVPAAAGAVVSVTTTAAPGGSSGRSGLVDVTA